MPAQLPVTQIMTSPVVTVTPDTTLEETLAMLAEHGVSGAPVVDAGGRLVGLLDDSDLLMADARLHGPTAVELLGAWIPLPGETRRYEKDLRHALGQTAGEVMDPRPPSVGTDAVVGDVATLMHDRDVSRVPVTGEHGEVVGIVTRGDVIKAMATGGAGAP